MATPEGRVKKKITAMLKEHGIWYFMPGNNGYGKSGVPDYVAIVGGQFWGIEAKAPRGKQTALQIKRMAEIEAAGGKYFLVNDELALYNLKRNLIAHAAKQAILGLGGDNASS